MTCLKKEHMNYNNFKDFYINSDYSNFEKKRVKGTIIGKSNKHTFITIGLKHDVESIKMKECINLIEDDFFVLFERGYGRFSIMPKSSTNWFLKYKVVGNRFTNGFSFFYTKLIQNVLLASSEGTYGLILKRLDDKSLLISLKKREPFYLARCKFLTKYNRWLLVIDNNSYFFKMIKPIITKRIYSSLGLKLLRNLDKK